MLHVAIQFGPWLAAILIGIGAGLSHVWGRYLDAFESNLELPRIPQVVILAYILIGITQALGGAIIGWSIVALAAPLAEAISQSMAVSIVTGSYLSAIVNRATWRAAMETRFGAWLDRGRKNGQHS